MSLLIQSGLPCDSCGSSDAKAEYENSFYCFSCRTQIWKPKDNSFFGTKEGRISRAGDVELTRGSFPLSAKAWLAKRYIYDDMITLHNLSYVVNGTWQKGDKLLNLSNRILVEQVVDGRLIRQFRSYKDQEIPKVYTIAPPHATLTFVPYLESGTPNHSILARRIIVLVEDVFSAIRISKFLPAMALLGTHLSDEKLLQIIKNYDTIIVWLDGDEPGQRAASKIVKRLSNYKPNGLTNIVTKDDPKWYQDAELREYLKDYTT